MSHPLLASTCGDDVPASNAPRSSTDYEATLGRIMAGADSTPVPEGCWPTPGQLWHQLLTSTREEREEHFTRYLRLAGQRASDSTPEAINVGDQTIVTVTVPRAPKDCPLRAIHEDAGAVEVGEHRVIEDVHGTLTLCPMCRSAVVLEPDQIQPGPAPEGHDDIDWDDHPDQVGDAARAHAEASGLDEFHPTTTTNPALTVAESAVSNATIRAWCAAQDPPIPCNAKGAVRADARAAYFTAHREARP